jgi:hypothetical protein
MTDPKTRSLGHFAFGFSVIKAVKTAYHKRNLHSFFQKKTTWPRQMRQGHADSKDLATKEPCHKNLQQPLTITQASLWMHEPKSFPNLQ